MLMNTLNYLIFSITFPYGEQIDDVLDEMIQERLENVYLGFEYFGSKTDRENKTSQYSMKFKETDSYIVDDVMYELSNNPLFTHTEIEWAIMDEDTAEQEGYSF
jgi:hypothetical protein